MPFVEVGFTVTKLGPLGQISVPVVDLGSLIQLSVGIYGWWKALERKASFIQVLKTSDWQLVSTSTFDTGRYELAREGTVVQGVALSDGRLSTANLPMASTALPPAGVPRNPAELCLRALITGLLCFYQPNHVTHILSYVIPGGLLDFDTDAAPEQLEGHVLASLRQYIDAIAIEEDSNTLRRVLLERVDEMQVQVTRATRVEVQRSESMVYGDSMNIIGLLRWIVTPIHKRDISKYPTCSLGAWQMAFVLSVLGFEVSASTFVINTKESYVEYISATQSETPYPDVMLVTASVGDTDPWATSDLGSATIGQELPRPRIVPIKAIPWIVFRHIGKDIYDIDTKDLADIWDYTFTKVMHALKRPVVRPGGSVVISTEPGHMVEHNQHKEILGRWSPGLTRVLREPMESYFPHVGIVSSEDLDAFAETLYDSNISYATIEEARASRKGARTWLVVTTIVIATVFSVCCKSMESDAGQQTEVAVRPDIIRDRKTIKEWSRIVGLALQGLVNVNQWTEFMLKLVVGEWQETESSNGIDVSSYASGAIFGRQANGIAIVSDLLVKPSACVNTLVTFHVAVGQLLYLPLDDAGYVRAARPRSSTFLPTINPHPENTIIKSKAHTEKIRIDVDTSWESDARSVVFRVREEGVCITAFSPIVVSHRLQNNIANCSCGQYLKRATVNLADRLQLLSVRKCLDSRASRIGVDNNDRVVINAGDDKSMQLYSLGVIDIHDMVYSTECIGCALNKLSGTAPAAVIAGWLAED